MVKHPRMILYLDKVQELLKAFPTFTIQQVPRVENMHADALASLGWQDLIIGYLMNGNLPIDKSEAGKVQQKAARYYMHDNKLIRKSYSSPHLTCIKFPQTLQDGKCGNHFRGRSFAQKALNVDYFWPTMPHDSTEYIKKCDRC
ncbi:hypothetical protein L3X38_032540 [Prunus dulcis]|uniref:RNase H type-1 domain-containing protein n=1 Tax=Prunus dulcis TaxID=3755 RepID=A0AAD4YWQ5_PRUDU|nr:hypothetical protein L3X38_032540 [Prunus dulcis]